MCVGFMCCIFLVTPLSGKSHLYIHGEKFHICTAHTCASGFSFGLRCQFFGSVFMGNFAIVNILNANNVIELCHTQITQATHYETHASSVLKFNSAIQSYRK